MHTIVLYSIVLNFILFCFVLYILYCNVLDEASFAFYFFVC